MKIKPLFNYKGYKSFLFDYLRGCGVDENDLDSYVNPDKSLFQSPFLYKNMVEAVDRLDEGIENKEKIGIVVD